MIKIIETIEKGSEFCPFAKKVKKLKTGNKSALRLVLIKGL